MKTPLDDGPHLFIAGDLNPSRDASMGAYTSPSAYPDFPNRACTSLYACPDGPSRAYPDFPNHHV